MNKKKKIIIIAVVIIIVIAAFYFIKMKPASDAKAYILNWQMTNSGNQAAVAAAVPSMSGTELTEFADVLKFIATQPVGWNGVLPADMTANMATIMHKYNIPGL